MKLQNHLFLSLIFLCWIAISPVQSRKPENSSEVLPSSDPPLAAFSADNTEGCAPFTVQFSDQSTNNPTSWNWTFEGGSPGTSNQQNPTVVYLNPGVYSVTLTVSNASGSDTLIQQNYITALGPPIAAFDASTNLDSLFLTNNSTDADSYLWNFGDGHTDTSSTPLPHIYTQDGTYTVSLTATNSCGSNTTSTQISITTPPTAAFMASPSQGCAPLNVQFINQSSDNTTAWNWTFEGGEPATSTEQNPIVNYLNPGTYSVTLTASNAAGSHTTIQEAYIVVSINPIADFQTMTNLDTLFLTNNSSNASSYLWDFGDGTTDTTANPGFHIYEQDGTYTVTLTAINACSNHTVSFPVTIATPPTADFFAIPTEGCAPLIVQFVDQSSENAMNWSWTFEGGEPATSNDKNPVVTYLNPGTYGVTLSASNNAGIDTFIQEAYITVLDIPTASFNTNIISNLLFLTNNSSDANTYLWIFGDGTTNTAANPPPHIYQQDGSYTVVLIATNPCGSDTTSTQITIATPPVASFTAEPTSGCVPFVVQFTDQSSDNTTSWNWTFEGGEPATSTDPNPLVTYLNPGTYGVTLTASNSTGSSTLTLENYITASDIPTASFDATTNLDSLFLTNNSSNADTYLWIFGDGNTDSTANPGIHVYEQDGTYTVLLITTNSCGSDTASLQLTIATPPTANFTADSTSGCVPFVVQFSDQSSDNTTSWNWTFEGGEPATSTDPNPLVTYLNPGTYGVTLTASNSTGSSTSALENYIAVNTTPTADFGLSINLDTLFLTDSSTYADTYLWDFGDGTIDTTPNPSLHIYEQDGTYTVVLITTNSCGSDTASLQLTIATPPTANFTADSTSGCVPFVVQFTDQSSDNTTSWNWTFEGGEPATSTDPNPLVTYLNPGTYGVTLTASNSTGSSTSALENYIAVNDLPEVDFTLQIDGTLVDFSSNIVNANSLLWDFGDGDTSTEQNPQHNYVVGETYLVVLTATNECGEVTAQQEITIGPISSFEADIQSGCTPLEVQFANLSSEDAQSFSWHFPGGEPAYSTSENPMVTYQQAGTYDVTLIVSNDNGSDTLTLTNYITALDVPQVNFNYTIAGATVNFQNASLDANTYVWSFGDGQTSTEVHPTYTYNLIGTYTVSLTATNSCGTSSISQEIDIQLEAPFALFEADATSGCAPFQVQFTDLSLDNPTAWEWTFEGGTPATSTEQNPLVTYDSPGTYSVTLFVSNPGGSNMLVQEGYIHVLDIPSADFTYTQDELTLEFASNTLGADTYFWDFGDGQNSSLMNPSHTYAAGGSYTVTLTVSNACGQSSSEQTLVLTTATTEPSFSSDWLLYPNPNSGDFLLEYTGEMLLFDVQILDVQGREWFAFRQMQAGAAATPQSFQLGMLPAGTYLVKLTAKEKTAYLKMVVQQ